MSLSFRVPSTHKKQDSDEIPDSLKKYNLFEDVQAASMISTSHLTDWQELEICRESQNMRKCLELVLSEESLPMYEKSELDLDTPEWMEPPSRVGELAFNLLSQWLRKQEMDKRCQSNSRPYYQSLVLCAQGVISLELIPQFMKKITYGGKTGDSTLYFFYYLTKIPYFNRYLYREYPKVIEALEYPYRVSQQRFVQILALASTCNIANGSDWMPNEQKILEKLANISDLEEEDILIESIIRAFGEKSENILKNIVGEGDIELIIYNLMKDIDVDNLGLEDERGLGGGKGAIETQGEVQGSTGETATNYVQPDEENCLEDPQINILGASPKSSLKKQRKTDSKHLKVPAKAPRKHKNTQNNPIVNQAVAQEVERSRQADEPQNCCCTIF